MSYTPRDAHRGSQAIKLLFPLYEKVFKENFSYIPTLEETLADIKFVAQKKYMNIPYVDIHDQQPSLKKKNIFLVDRVNESLLYYTQKYKNIPLDKETGINPNMALIYTWHGLKTLKNPEVEEAFLIQLADASGRCLPGYINRACEIFSSFFDEDPLTGKVILNFGY